MRSSGACRAWLFRILVNTYRDHYRRHQRSPVGHTLGEDQEERIETMLFGTSRCDGVYPTQRGTILATEETDDGHGYEILDPIGTTGRWIADRASGNLRDAIDSPNPSTTIVQRQSLPTMAWEGLTKFVTRPPGRPCVFLGRTCPPGRAKLQECLGPLTQGHGAFGNG